MDGIINVYKEAGFTSHDVVAKLRGILRQKKIGHTGTLDPQAVGVLPICLGKATKVCELLTNEDKAYHAVCRLGVQTDTQDMTGTVVETKDFHMVTETLLRQTVASFVGEIQQIPPMYSALKVNGKKLYELAREGKTVERKPRRITISQITISSIDLEQGLFTMDITCSKGTYIRTLCHDIGQKLGTGACMEHLTRTRVSVFAIEQALSLDEIQELYDKHQIQQAIIPVDSLFCDYPAFQTNASGERKLSNGNWIEPDGLIGMTPGMDCHKLMKGSDCLIYDSKGDFRAIYQWSGKEFRVTKMF